MLLILLLLVTRVISETVYLQATVLFYGDEYNRTHLITGPLPNVLDAIITKDLEYKIPSNIHPVVKVVPVYNYVSDIPSDDPHDIYEKLLKAYPNLIKADFPEDSRKYFKLKAEENTNDNLNSTSKYKIYPNGTKEVVIGQKEEKMTTRVSTSPPKHSTHTTYRKASTATPYRFYPEIFVPNDIYYAVEKKCANWAENCDHKSGSILDLPIKTMHMPQHFYMKKFVFEAEK